MSDTLISEPFPTNYSAQAAELEALIEACKLATGKTATLYTESNMYLVLFMILAHRTESFNLTWQTHCTSTILLCNAKC